MKKDYFLGEKGLASTVFQFKRVGSAFRLKGVFLVAENEGDEIPLKRATGRLLNPAFLEEIRRFFRRPQFD